MSNVPGIKLKLPNKKIINLPLDGNESELLDLLAMLSEISPKRIKGIKDNFDNYYTVSSALKNKNNFKNIEGLYYELIFKQERSVKRRDQPNKASIIKLQKEYDNSSNNVSKSRHRHSKKKSSNSKGKKKEGYLRLSSGEVGSNKEESVNQRSKSRNKRSNTSFKNNERNHTRIKTEIKKFSEFGEQIKHSYKRFNSLDHTRFSYNQDKIQHFMNYVNSKTSKLGHKLSSAQNMHSNKLYMMFHEVNIRNKSVRISFSKSSSSDDSTKDKQKLYSQSHKKVDGFSRSKYQIELKKQGKRYKDDSAKSKNKKQKLVNDGRKKKVLNEFDDIKRLLSKKNDKKDRLKDNYFDKIDNLESYKLFDNSSSEEESSSIRKSNHKHNANANFYFNLYPNIEARDDALSPSFPTFGANSKANELSEYIGRQGSVHFYKKFLRKFGKRNVLSNNLFRKISELLSSPEGKEIIKELDSFLEGEKSREELISFLKGYDNNKIVKKSVEIQDRNAHENKTEEAYNNIDTNYYKEYDELRKSLNDTFENYFTEEDLKLVKQMFKYENKDLIEEVKAYKVHKKVNLFISGLIKILNNFKFKKNEQNKLENSRDKIHSNKNVNKRIKTSHESSPDKKIQEKEDSSKKKITKKKENKFSCLENSFGDLEKIEQIQNQSKIPLSSLSRIMNPLPREKFQRITKKKQTEITDGLKKKMIYKKLNKTLKINLNSEFLPVKKTESEHFIAKRLKLVRKTNRLHSKTNSAVEIKERKVRKKEERQLINSPEENRLNFSATENSSSNSKVKNKEKKIKFEDEYLSSDNEEKIMRKNKHKTSILKNKKNIEGLKNHFISMNKGEIKETEKERGAKKNTKDKKVSVKESNINRNTIKINLNKNIRDSTKDKFSRFKTKIEPNNLIKNLKNNLKSKLKISRNFNQTEANNNSIVTKTEEAQLLKTKSSSKQKKKYQTKIGLTFKRQNKGFGSVVYNKYIQNNKEESVRKKALNFLNGKKKESTIKITNSKNNDSIKARSKNADGFSNIKEYFDYLLASKKYDLNYINFLNFLYKTSPFFFNKNFNEYKKNKNEHLLRQNIENYVDNYFLTKKKNLIKVLVETGYLNINIALQVNKLLDQKNKSVTLTLDNFLKNNKKEELIQTLKKIVRQNPSQNENK